ncbi:hypothetical protein BDN70DRAFT_939787 [Pholiota conissans]|uniref:Uncharacterized protein n=1 Tax=Pholiota conissans TaxID=109636 RepID=A0A9P5YKL1_9AGAR|nr:hypothetical protein BDN70DRAFT_939787 [Pholiota conissans]
MSDDKAAYREEIISYPGRPNDAPPIILAYNHPLLPPGDKVPIRRVIIWFMDTSYEEMTVAYKKEQTLTVPYVNDVQKLKLDAIRKNLLAVALDISTSTLMMGPPATVAILEKHSEVINALRCGSSQTKGFTTFQLNLAGAQDADTMGALDQLGRAGVPHFDRNDQIGSFTDTLCCSDIPDDFEPGIMFILLPMMFTKLVKYRGLKFSGLHMHGGTPPTAPIDGTLSGWETRIVCVSYRSGLTAKGSARYPLCATPSNQDVIYSTPEMRFPERYAQELGKINRATYARDGLSLTDNKGLAEFLAREIYCYGAYILRNAPAELKLMFDSDHFSKSVSYVGVDGKRKRVSPWIYPPGWRPYGASRKLDEGEEVEDLEDQTDFRLQALDEISAHDDMLGKFLPLAVATKKVNAMKTKDIEWLISSHKTDILPGDYAGYSPVAAGLMYQLLKINIHE